MSNVVAVLDADVPVPILSCDLLLTAFDHDLYRPVTTPRILDEVERNLVEAHPDLEPGRLRRRVEHMQRALELHMRADTGSAVGGINHKDHHVVAAALEASADVVVTNDRRLQREIDALDEPLEALSADEFATGLVASDAHVMDAVIDDLVAKRVMRPISRDDLLSRLERAFPSLVAALA